MLVPLVHRVGRVPDIALIIAFGALSLTFLIMV
jgi:hypothetical protein